MASNSLDKVRKEIQFFMDKSFQISLGYAGTLIGVAALTRLKTIETLSKELSISATTIVSCAVLFANFAYLLLATACIFAVLKRGYFLLLQDVEGEEAEGGFSNWEIFVRLHPKTFAESRIVNVLAWNVDNFYMLPLFGIIIVTSVFAVVLGWRADTSNGARAIVATLFALHLLPAGALVATSVLNQWCLSEAKRRSRKENDDPRPNKPIEPTS